MYKIFYHNDLDGVITASAFILRNKLKKEKYILSPISSEGRTIFNKIVSRNIMKGYDVVSLDFDRADRLSFWCDHHSVDGVSYLVNENVLYDKNAKSAASLYIRNLLLPIEEDKLFFNNAKRYEEVAVAIDMVDSASYESIRYYKNSLNPIMTLKRYVDLKPDLNEVVELLAKTKLNLKKAIKTLEINPEMLRSMAIDSFKTGDKFEFIDYGFIALCKEECNSVPRYAEFDEHSSTAISIRVSVKDVDSIIVRVSKNPWMTHNPFANIDLSVPPKYSDTWGGHKNVAGGVIPMPYKDLFIDSLIETLMDYRRK